MIDFRKLEFWKKSHNLCLDIYRYTETFPKSELYGLTSQIRRASASVPTNIAEGSGRKGKKELLYFFNIAVGSLSETEYLLLLTSNLNYMKKETTDMLINEIVEIRKIMFGYIEKVNHSI
jgi:four helix bundle protein